MVPITRSKTEKSLNWLNIGNKMHCVVDPHQIADGSQQKKLSLMNPGM
jgi:hypothetical protein